MELIIGIIIIAGLGYVLYNANKPKPKAEAPVQESAPAVAPAKEVTTEASPPAAVEKAPAKKAPAKKAKPAAKKPAPAKKPALAKKPAKPKK